MIVSLTIKDIVLIDRLQMDFEDGLSVLSGETGAGKSILLSGIGLAIGARSGREIIRQGQDQGSVTAEFSLSEDHRIWDVLNDQGLDHEDGQLILRRVIGKDGRSRAFINDQSVSITLLRQIGETLVEIHGQHDERGLLNPSGHRSLLDDFGDYQELHIKVRNNFDNLTALQDELADEQAKLEQAKQDEDYIRYNLEELDQLNPQEGEEEELAKERTRMMQGENLSEGLGELLNKLLSDKGVDTVLRATIRKMERMAAQAPGLLEGVSENLDRAANETADAIAELEEIIRNLEFNPYDLENTEERLFALRAAARKHNCQADQLPALKAEFEEKLSTIQYGDEEVRRLTEDVYRAQTIFEANVEKLSKEREMAAAILDAQVNEELPALKMDKAEFKTFLEPLDKEHWNGEGGERIDFRVSTNPGAPFGGLVKIASGGELSRFILALKVVLARKTSVATLIFDEIDQGVGGAVANAVGERLSELSDKGQILVITHSPQVAARGKNHWLIKKAANESDGPVTTAVTPLSDDLRREEIARMLAGAEITNEARAAADNLLDW
ncbi:DNA repair protein RecN [Pseudemcibacter aquimaris]|uniref:DNA repair protein RecN n=1 Tax=Pseudemcibacter aquimaris TaxID=2857064 RepID=UPI002012A120|nr:DNA repair protein RecN [Pseudemcibacter aquimaris]MCC3861357.1 DNA repair protein RecN [Pseudemcibacter aquimaris]WDU58129.1 DNA repair protein RecN [Pseudemcibacter aquimaris]